MSKTWQEEWSEWILRQPWRGSGNHRISFAAGWLMGQAQLRASLAKVTAEMDDMRKSFDRTIDREDALRRELAETRKALEEEISANANAEEVSDELKSTRAALARSVARVKELEEEREHDVKALRVATERVKAGDGLLRRCLSGAGEVHGTIRAEINTHLDGSNG